MRRAENALELEATKTPAGAVWVPLSQLVPWGKNPRKNDQAAPEVAEVIVAVGWGAAGVAWTDPKTGEKRILVGHTRRKAVLYLPKLWEIHQALPAEERPRWHPEAIWLRDNPSMLVRWRDDLTEEEATILALADNKKGETAEWDDAMLAEILADFDLQTAALAGWSENEIDQIMADLDVGPPDEGEEIPEPPKTPVTKPGDIWVLGDHRIICGDSTDADTVARLLDGATPFIMVTDPPFGVDYDPSWRTKAAEKGLINGPGTRMGKVENDGRRDWSDAYQLFEGDVAYVWHAAVYVGLVEANLAAHGFKVRSQIIWLKPEFAISRGHYHWRHEACWYAVRKGKTAKWVGGRRQSTIWEINNKGISKEDRNDHGTQKPVECMLRPVRNHGGRDDAVYDPFLGTGTTLVAAEQVNRKSFGCEISPAYCDVIIERWQNLTGRRAQRKR